MIPHNKTPAHVVAKVQEMINAGATRAEIVSKTGIRRDRILRLFHAGELTSLPVRAPYLMPPQSMSNLSRVPQWVERDLRGEYREYIGLYGEEHAARLVRRMQAEAR